MRGAWLLALGVLLAAPAVAKDKPAASDAPAKHKPAKAKAKPTPSGAKLKTETEHLVREGETLGGIANRAEVPRVLIIEANHLKKPYAVHAGQRLVIPRRRSHTVKEGETGLSIAMDYGIPWHAIAEANGLKPKAELTPGQTLAIPTLVGAKPAKAEDATPAPEASASPEAKPKDAKTPPVSFAWPVEGKIRRGFVPRKNGKSSADFHDGIDILADEGTAARASAAGKVIFAGDGPKEYGHTVVIHHGGRWTTVYSYLQKITVKLGDHVKAGERIGLVGQSGLAHEPQLHFEIRHAKNATDPMAWLAKKGAE